MVTPDICKIKTSNMKTNLSLLDKVIRITLAFGITVLYLSGSISELIALIGLLVALFFVATGFSGYCPVYKVFGVRTHLDLNERSYKSRKKFKSI